MMAACSCCRRKKRFFESFENIGNGGAVCIQCSDILYKIHDTKIEKNTEDYNKNIDKITEYIDKGEATINFTKWFKEDFLKRNAL